MSERPRKLVSLARSTTLGVCLLAMAGCATSRWVDDHTPGDLWGTAGREMGLMTWLRQVSADRPAQDGTAQDGAADDRAVNDEAVNDEAVLEMLIELVLAGAAIW